MSMPTSATGTSIRDGLRPLPVLQRGFSLLEILVVVAIVGIFVGVAVLSTDLISFDRKVEQEANRLRTLLNYTSEDALMQGRDYGITFYEDGYRFFLFDHRRQTWLPLDEEDAFAARPLPDDMIFELWMEQLPVQLQPFAELPPQLLAALAEQEETLAEDEEAEEEEEDEEDDEIEFPQPQVLIFSSGEFTPFELEILRESNILEPGLEIAVEFDGSTEIARSEP